MAHDWRETLSIVAPTLAAMAESPLGGTAMSAVSTVLFGKPDAPEDEIARALATASPTLLAALQQVEKDVTAQMTQLGIDVHRRATQPHTRARREGMPLVLALFSFCGFFATLGALVFIEVPASGQAPLNIMLGGLSVMITSITAYYFGSSAGSARKTELLSHNGRSAAVER